MPILNICGGEQGGVGKSTVAGTILQYHIDHELPFSAFDLDRSNADVKRRFGKVCDVHLAILSEAQQHEDAANALFNAALEQNVICNLPAQVLPALNVWIEHNQLIELAVETDVQLRIFHVAAPSFESRKLLSHSLNLFGDHIPHVLVKNLGMPGRWEQFEDEDLTELIEAYDLTVIEFPKFIGNSEKEFMDAQSMSYGEALRHPDLGPISKQRIKGFLRKAYDAFEDASLFTQKPKYVHEIVPFKRPSKGKDKEVQK